MQTLGVSGDRKGRDEGRLKTIFWPAVENAWDVDTIGRQGFWVCVLIGAYQVIIGIVAGGLASVVFGVIAGLVYFLGAMGVRETNWPAAALVFALFSVNLFFAFATARFPGFLVVVAEALLLTTLRAAVIASRLAPTAEGEDRPTRFNETFRDKLADQLPASAWPVLRIPFFVLGGILLLLSVAGTLVILFQRLGLLTSPAALSH